MLNKEFPVGTKFILRGACRRLCTVVDVFKTYNSKGKMVKIQYVASYESRNMDTPKVWVVPAITVALGYLEEETKVNKYENQSTAQASR